MEKYLNKKTSNCLVVDFDGTIVDSETLFWEIFRKKVKLNYNVDFTKEHELMCIGFGDDQIEEFFDKNFNINSLDEEFYNNITLEYMNNVRLNGTAVNIDLLKYISSKNVDTYILTNNKVEVVNELLNQLGVKHLFKGVVCPGDYDKTKLDIHKELIEVYGVHNITFYDDLEYNVNIASELGINSILVKDVNWVWVTSDKHVKL